MLLYLLRQWHLYWHRNNFCKQAAVESHPEHSRVTVWVNQRHLEDMHTSRKGDDYCQPWLHFYCSQVHMSIKSAYYASLILTRSPGLSTGSFLVPNLFKRVYASLRLRLHSFPADDKTGIRDNEEVTFAPYLFKLLLYLP